MLLEGLDCQNDTRYVRYGEGEGKKKTRKGGQGTSESPACLPSPSCCSSAALEATTQAKAGKTNPRKGDTQLCRDGSSKSTPSFVRTEFTCSRRLKPKGSWLQLMLGGATPAFPRGPIIACSLLFA